MSQGFFISNKKGGGIESDSDAVLYNLMQFGFIFMCALQKSRKDGDQLWLRKY